MNNLETRLTLDNLKSELNNFNTLRGMENYGNLGLYAELRARRFSRIPRHLSGARHYAV